MTVNHDSLFHAKNSLVSVLKNKTTCGKETTRLNQNYVWTSADRAGRQVTLLIPPFLLVFLGIIAEGCLDGRKVLPQIIVLFPGGLLDVYMTGGPTYFFGLKFYTLGIFLGQEICHVFF